MITFTYEHTNLENEHMRIPAVKVSVQTDAVGIEEVAEQFKYFLLACGYHPDNVRELFGEDD
jgi:Tat protein secretion system quality control protein TatD with DNase activity